MKKTLFLTFVAAAALLFATSCKPTIDTNVTVRTVPAYDLTYDGFKTGAEITSSDTENCKVGACCGYDPDLTIQNGTFKMGDTVCFSELWQYEQYYYRAFAAFDLNGDGLLDKFVYGNVLSLSPEERPLRVYTRDPDVYSWDHSIHVIGEVEGAQLYKVNQVGFCYSEENEYPQYDSDLYVVAGTPTGGWYYSFNSYINILSGYHKYYIRAYARLTDTIQYGNVQTIEIQ